MDLKHEKIQVAIRTLFKNEKFYVSEIIRAAICLVVYIALSGATN